MELERSSSQSLHVFLVDGRSDRRARLERQLSRDGELFLTGTAADGIEAIARLRHAPPDVVLMGTAMPRMDGLTLLRVLKSVVEVPVVVLADEPEVESVLDALSLGAVGYLATDDVMRLPAPAIRARLSLLLRKPAGVPCALLAPETAGEIEVQLIGAPSGEMPALAAHLRTHPSTNGRAIFGLLDSPPWFVSPLAGRLHRSTSWRVFAARPGDHLAPGHALLASIQQGLRPVRDGGRLRVVAGDGWHDLATALASLTGDGRHHNRSGGDPFGNGPVANDAAGTTRRMAA